MNLLEEIRTGIFKLKWEDDFSNLALKTFAYQFESNPLLRQFSGLLHISPAEIKHYRDIPFLPVSFFRGHQVVAGNKNDIVKVFSSSGTTGSIPSKHYIRDLALYEESFVNAFRYFYGDPENYRFLALLPGYLERDGSSLVYMMDYLVRKTKGNGSGFYLHDFKSLKERLTDHPEAKVKTVLFGASYALLDFAENYPLDLQQVVIMETGGMKGRRKEMVREELHEILCSRFNAGSIHSEYGMTELLSQGYSSGNGIFNPPPWMKVLIRDPNDPLQLLPAGQTGGINIIDLANINSCSFIATQDLGKLHDDGSFEVLGRFDDSDVRGCNLLVV